MTTRDAIQSPPPDQEIPRDSGHSFARDPSLRPKARWLSHRIKALLAFEFFILGIATCSYVFGVRPQVNNANVLLAIDVLFSCSVCTIADLFILIVILLNRSQPSSP